jgi:hypothetical protein
MSFGIGYMKRDETGRKGVKMSVVERGLSNRPDRGE